MFKSFSKNLVNLFSLILLLALTVVAIKADDLKAEEIIAKHLDSIGSQEKRNAVKNRLAAARSEFTSKVPIGRLVGKALIVSEGSNLYFISSFNSQNYPFERIGLFDKKVSIPFTTPGNRSPLGGFLQDNNKIITERLFGGSISSSWILMDSDIGKAKLNTAGKKKIDGHEAYVLNFIPKGGISSDFAIRLYFDTQTFRHLRTEYQQNIPARHYKAGILGGNAEAGAKNLLIEDFRDFKEAEGLTLPHSYKIYLLLDSQTTTHEYEWKIEIVQYLFNQKLDAGFFTFDEK